MKYRCLNPKSDSYHHYGGRGIGVETRWLTFENFLEDMGERPEGLTLERNDVNKSYSKSNCRWATRKEQMRNRTNTVYVEKDGEKVQLSKLIEKSPASDQAVRHRLAKGMSLSEALAKPCDPRPIEVAIIAAKKSRMFVFRGVEGTLNDHCKRFGLNFDTVKYRLRNNWGMDRSFDTPVKGSLAT